MSGPKTSRAAGGMRNSGEVLRFERRTVQPPTPGLTVTWEALHRQLVELAVTPAQKRLAATLVSATRKQAAFKPSEQVLREVLCIASVLMDETFHPAGEEGGMS